MRTDSLAAGVQELYARGAYQEAELLALRALQDPARLSKDDQALLHKFLGFTYVALNEKEKSKNQFADWLEIDPRAQLDSIYISPKIIDVFREAQAEFKSHPAPANTVEANRLQAQIRAVQRSLILPGLGQAYRGQRTKGYSLIAAEALSLAAFAYCRVQYADKHKAYDEEKDPARFQAIYDDMNLYYRGQYAAALLAASIYLYSLFDAAYLPPKTDRAKPLSLGLGPSPYRLITISLTR